MTEMTPTIFIVYLAIGLGIKAIPGAINLLIDLYLDGKTIRIPSR